MPMYDFKCPKCGHLFDDLMSYKTWIDGTTVCPSCSVEFKCSDGTFCPAPAGIKMGGIFTDLTSMQKNNERLKKKTSKG